MKKLIIVLMLLTNILPLTACADDGILTESTIVSKEMIDGSYYFNVTYDIEGFFEPLTATIKVSKTVFNQHNIGDTYMFTRTDTSKNYRNS